MPGRPVDRLTAANLRMDLQQQKLERYLRRATAHQAGTQQMRPDEIEAWRSAVDAAVYEAEEAAEELLWALRHYRLAAEERETRSTTRVSPVVPAMPGDT